EMGADFDVLVVDLRHLDAPALHFGLDDARRRRALILDLFLEIGSLLRGRGALAALVAIQPAPERAAADKARRSDQKKNAKPSFHSSVSSLSSRLVKTTWLLYSPRRKKRRVR